MRDSLFEGSKKKQILPSSTLVLKILASISLSSQIDGKSIQITENVSLVSIKELRHIVGYY